MWLGSKYTYALRKFSDYGADHINYHIVQNAYEKFEK